MGIRTFDEKNTKWYKLKMSYEKQMLERYAMPSRLKVERALLQSLLKNGGSIKEFGEGQDIVENIANEFGLTDIQQSAFLQTTYRKENRLKKSNLWHRLLFRAAHSLANEKLVSRPTQTFILTNKREWMLTEKGYDKALKISKISIKNKNMFQTKSYEVQKIVKKLKESKRPENYNPIDKEKKVAKVTRESLLRSRGFRFAVIEAYNCKCAICGLKLSSPDAFSWEVEAAHIVPHHSFGKDDIWNGLALCHLHHWAFDVGWFTLKDDFTIQVSNQINTLPTEYGMIGDYELFRSMLCKTNRIILPNITEYYPHLKAISWHRDNIFFQI